MNGAQHYAEAEHLLAFGADADRDDRDQFFAEAQVHATLALAGATALTTSQGTLPVKDRNAWQEVAGVMSASTTPDRRTT